MKERVKYCDTLKALSIILVILIHVFSIYRDLYINTNRLYYTILTLGDSFTRIAVPSFLMITGIFMLSKKSEKKLSKAQLFFEFSCVYQLFVVILSAFSMVGQIVPAREALSINPERDG